MRIGHFYFGKNRTFLNWLDKNERIIDIRKLKSYIKVEPMFVLEKIKVIRRRNANYKRIVLPNLHRRNIG